MNDRKKKNTAAFMLGGGDADETTSAPIKELDRPVTGNYARQAYQAIQRQRDDAQEEAIKANETFYNGVLAGAIPIAIPASQISDIVGTDRVAMPDHDPKDPAFRELVENIKTRGLRTPVRVRPLDAGWRPDARFPRDVSGVSFALQSGRRRMAACIELGIDPLCFLAFTDADGARLDDLHERFFENAARKNLTTYEYLYSLGLIAREVGGSQDQIAENLNISQPVISRAVAVVDHAEALAKEIDPKVATRNDIDAALKRIRNDLKSPDPRAKAKRETRREKPKAPALPFRKKSGSWGKAELAPGRGKKLKLSIESDRLTDATLDRIINILEQD
jgi:ParB/RepB/Spo0J family partition protein